MTRALLVSMGSITHSSGYSSEEEHEGVVEGLQSNVVGCGNVVRAGWM